MVDKLCVCEGHINVLEKLLDARIGHLVVLGGDEDAGGGDQLHDVGLSLAPEMPHGVEVFTDVGYLQVGVEGRHTVMEGLFLVLELTAESAHPLDVIFASAHVERTWTVLLAHVLLFYEAVQDSVHRDLGFEALVLAANSINAILIEGTVSVPVLLCLLNSSLILEGSAGGAIPNLGHLLVGQEDGQLVGALVALEGELEFGALFLRCDSTQFLFSTELQVNHLLLGRLLGGGSHAERGG